MTDMTRRNWVPDLEDLARQLIRDIRGAYNRSDPDEGLAYAELDAIGTFGRFEQMAAAAGGEITSDDYQSLAILLAKMAVGIEPVPE
jgi:hypothetical protein